jgi:KDO2-lipid IV(A) lauroyltransferase
LGYPLIAVALPHKERSINNLFNGQRESQGMTIVANNVAFRECIKGLRENRLVALLGDRDFNSAGEILDFFGKKTRIPKGPAAFSLKTGAAIVPAFLTRDQGDHFTLTFEKPIFPPEHVDDATLHQMMQQYIKIVEEAVRRHPTQWYMFQRFWIE